MEINSDVSLQQKQRHPQLPLWVIVLAFAVLLGFMALIAWACVYRRKPIVIGQKCRFFNDHF